MPAYGVGADEAAGEVLRRAFPNRQLVSVRINQLAHGGGGIHCVHPAAAGLAGAGVSVWSGLVRRLRGLRRDQEERFMNKVVATMQFACQGERVSGRVSG